MDQSPNLLGDYLKDRRARLDPSRFGFSASRRRTPGLRREEVAQLANVSATWYTWLEQGRGGAPSADVLDRLSRAFALTEAEREHLYLLAQQRPPKARPAAPSEITPQLQRVLDAMHDTPAIIKTPEWTVLAWNRAAAAVLVNYDEMQDRNILRLLFRAGGHGHLPNWQGVARLIIGTVRRDILRAGLRPDTEALIEEISATSEEFRTLWAEPDLYAHGEGVKQIVHPAVGLLTLDYSSFAVDGYPDLSMVVFNPSTEEDRAKIRTLVA